MEKIYAIIFFHEDHVREIPYCPIVFILGLEGLSALIRKTEELIGVHGVKVCRSAQPVSLLLFSDDCFIFCEASIAEAGHFRYLSCFPEEKSRQQVNLAKSSVSFTETL